MRRSNSVVIPLLLVACSFWVAGCSDSEDTIADPAWTGTVHIDSAPDEVPAPWSLAGPNSYLETGEGDDSINNLILGEYTITWGDVDGWITPASDSQTLFGPDLVFVGAYEEDNRLPPALTQAELMLQLQDLYVGMDYEHYTEILDPGFRIILKPETVSDFGLENNYFTHDQDLQIMEKMFSGDPAGEDVPGITSISVLHLINMTPWEDSQNAEFPDASWAKYDVHFEFWQGSGDARQKMTVTGEIEFYLSSTPITYEGKERLQFKMVGQVDHSTGKSADPLAKPNEDFSWGSIKALFQ